MRNWLSISHEALANPVSEQQERELRELYNQMAKVAYAKVNNKSDAYDVVQEAWVRMLSKVDTLREVNKLSQWAKAITANVASNVNRAHAAKSYEWSESSAASRPEAATEAEIMIELSELLGSLDPRTRTMILYKFYYGLKDQEIASAMQIPVGTIKARIHRTKEQLKQQSAISNY